MKPPPPPPAPPPPPLAPAVAVPPLPPLPPRTLNTVFCVEPERDIRRANIQMTPAPAPGPPPPPPAVPSPAPPPPPPAWLPPRNIRGEEVEASIVMNGFRMRLLSAGLVAATTEPPALAMPPVLTP